MLSLPGNGRAGIAYTKHIPEWTAFLQQATQGRVQSPPESASHHTAALCIPSGSYYSPSAYFTGR